MSSLQRFAGLELQLETLMLLTQGGQFLIHLLVLAHQSSLHTPHLLASPPRHQMVKVFVPAGGAEGIVCNGGGWGVRGGNGRGKGLA